MTLQLPVQTDLKINIILFKRKNLFNLKAE